METQHKLIYSLGFMNVYTETQQSTGQDGTVQGTGHRAAGAGKGRASIQFRFRYALSDNK